MPDITSDSLEDYAIKCIQKANHVATGTFRHATLHEPTCLARHPLGYMCTRPLGHHGDHVAHGELHEVLQMWPANPDPIW